MRAPLLFPFVTYAHASARLRRWLDRGDRWAGALLTAALTSDEKSELGIRLYDASPLHRGSALLPWEQRWLERRLPPAPARILVGACGAGRELLALADAGYAVDAFEPARGLASLAEARLGERARIVTCRYEDLSAAVLDGSDGAAAPLASERYDAVLLGWGSLTHVLDAGERTRLFRALELLCPRGPLLASFWCTRDADGVRPVERMERYGAACGRAIASLRRLRTEPSPRESFTLHGGFVYRFTRAELEALARSVGRELVWEDDETDYPHATFLRV